MAVPEIPWPVQLVDARVRMNGSESTADPVVRSDSDHGPQETRLQFTAAVDIFTVTYRFTELDAGIFWGWFKNTCLYGSKTFDWRNPRTGILTSFTNQAARFRGVPESTNVAYSKSGRMSLTAPGLAAGSIYDIKMEIEILP